MLAFGIALGPADDPLPPAGDYEILREIGRGGMGVVYRAEQTKINRLVALKMLLPEYTVYPDLVARVEREARTAGQIDHSNVVSIVDLGSAQGTVVNGQKVNKHLLSTGDEITIGDIRIVVTIGEPQTVSDATQKEGTSHDAQLGGRTIAIEWLETMLIESGVTLFFITHDRSFLDRVCTRIVELDRGKLASFPGNFSQYQQRKEAMLHEEALANARADKLLKEEEVWIRKGVEARRTRAVFRVQRLDKLRAERQARRERMGKVNLQLDAGDKSGKLVAELEHVSKSYGERPIVRDFSIRIQRGDKIGVIGPNGAGKTTLLRMILGELQPDQGVVRQGTKIDVAYFDQFRTQLNPDSSLADVISPGSDYVEIGGARKHVIGYLEDFLFAPERARSPVSSLSGGERNRLLLARLFARPANVLVLDEPTNDLDIETLELLEELLQNYDGTLFLVSHDRTFLDNVVTQTIAAEGDGVWREYAGGYSDWASYKASLGRESVREKAEARPPAKAVEPAPAKVDKLSWKEARELEGLPGRIAALEGEQAELGLRLADASLYQSDPPAAQKAAERLAVIDDELMALLERWELLEARAGNPA